MANHGMFIFNYYKNKNEIGNYMANYSDEFFEECVDRLKTDPELSVRKLAKELDIPRTTLRRGLKRVGFSKEDQDIIEQINNAPNDQVRDTLIKLAKTKQRQADVMRVERKFFREKSRIVNALEEYSEKLLTVFKKKNLSGLTQVHKTKEGDYEGVIHLSDLHINEQVLLANNKFDVDIASKRIQKHVQHAKKVFKAYGVSKVTFAFTGDLLNSNRRVDELLINATNRANATFVAVDILQQAIIDVNQDFNVACANVTGNESRIEKDVGWINEVSQDNFDFVIFNTLAYLFKGSKGVTFHGPDDTYLEKVIDVAGQKFLLLHGHNGFARDTDKKIAAKYGQYAQKGIFIDYTIFGHIHSAVISDLYARSSGLPGSNNYSQNALDLSGKASQNIYVVGTNGEIHGMKVDLQDVDGYNGYNVATSDIYDSH